MNQSKIILSNNLVFFKLIFNLVDSSQLNEFSKYLQQKRKNWKVEINEDYYLLIGNNPIILLKTFNNFSVNFNLKIKLLATTYGEIPTQISGIQSQIFSKITLENNYQLSCLGTKISIGCAPLPSKTLPIIQKSFFENTKEPNESGYIIFDSYYYDLPTLKRKPESLGLFYESLREQGINISNYASGIFRYKSNIFIINLDQESLNDFPSSQAKLIYQSICMSLEYFCQTGPISGNEVHQTVFLLNTFKASKQYQSLEPKYLVPLFRTSMEVSMRCASPKLCVPYFILENQKPKLSGNELCQFLLEHYQQYQDIEFHFSHWKILDSDPFNPETESGVLVKNFVDSKNRTFPKNLKQLLKSLNNYRNKNNDEFYKDVYIH